LFARIRAVLRKSTAIIQPETPKALSFGSLHMNPNKREVHIKDDLIYLTKKEFDLLYYLLENKNIVVDRETIIEKVWGYDFLGETNAVDVYIRYLRTKIEEPYDLKIIHTVRGVGYVIKDE
jgi:two-component system response regulator ArlR